MPRTIPTPLRFTALLILLLLALAGTALPAQAVEFTNDGTLAAGETLDDDIFISADTVQIDGTVNGDLFLNCSRGTVSGVINGNLIANCADFTFDGEVNGSILFSGRSLHHAGRLSGALYGFGAEIGLEPTAEIGRNVFAFCGAFTSQPGSVVGRDLLVSTFQADLGGEVRRHAHLAGDAVDLRGKVGGDVEVEVSAPGGSSGVRFLQPVLGGGLQPAPTGLRIEEGAEIGGALRYASPVEQSDAFRSQPAGGVDFRMKAEAGQDSAAARWRQNFLDHLRGLVTLLILGGLALWLAPNLLHRLSERVQRAPLPSAGWGFVSLVMVFAGSLLAGLLILILGILMAVITLGGLSSAILWTGFLGLGLGLAVFVLLVAYGSKLVIVYLAGRLLLERFFPAQARPVWALLLGAVLYTLVVSIPILGLVVGALASLAGLGAIWLGWWKWQKPSRALAAPIEAV